MQTLTIIPLIEGFFFPSMQSSRNGVTQVKAQLSTILSKKYFNQRH